MVVSGENLDNFVPRVTAFGRIPASLVLDKELLQLVALNFLS